MKCEACGYDDDPVESVTLIEPAVLYKKGPEKGQVKVLAKYKYIFVDKKPFESIEVLKGYRTIYGCPECGTLKAW